MKYLDERFENIKVVGTHSGSFHADECMSTAILTLLFGKLEIIRTRDSEILTNCCDLVYDVGGGEFDHHQNEKKCRVNNEGIDTVPYSSAGLIWKEFGKALICKLADFELTEKQLERVWGVIDRRIMWGIDAMDNGAYQNTNEVVPYDITIMIDTLAPTWENRTEDSVKEAFETAVTLCTSVLKTKILYETSKMRAYNLVKADFEARENKQLLVLNSFYPYEAALRDLDTEKVVLFVCFPSDQGGWTLKTLRKGSTDYTNVLDLPAEWGGLQGAELGAVVGIDDAVFCHKNLFIASALSKESIIKMAEIALQNQEKHELPSDN